MDALVVHCPRNLERTWHRRLPITPPARILLDVAPTFPFAALRRALAEAFFLRLVSVEAIEGTLLRGHPGSAILRSALACHTPERARTKSWLEDRFLDLRERFGLPVPEINVSICGFEVDAAWREERVIAELDGGAAHGTVAAVDRDRSRDLKLRAAGWTVLRYSRRQITGDAAAVAADILRALGINHLDALCEARAGMNCPDAISQPRQESQVHG
ncbi:MAG: endonuclease domain-containing protein [Solirubrobacterales bacterium]